MDGKVGEVRKTPTFERWFKRLVDMRAKAKILSRIAQLEDGVWGDVRSVGDAVFELRIMFGPGYRLYATMLSGQVVLLVCGGDKSSQQRDIAKAKRYAQLIRLKEDDDEKPL
ncbi:type II toxin-antitoxin system RelE/ParE family toxin [Eggerthella sinensis]|uniref:type II toxin-antitoxin system RelE/ParE family toxin n=1 Tax=Eggerthella sinensis TaxID=242230 RepID=UPI00266B46CC|nr:type II toxin-antitoxin system RelE/ParE family toxin [Eggerthella sinensis]